MKRILFLLAAIVLFSNYSFAQLERRFLIWNKNEVVIQPWKKFDINFAEKIHYSPKRDTLDLKLC